jgi:mannitol-1-phosphate/altronate dehydrogenase
VKRLDLSTIAEIPSRLSRPHYEIAGLGVGIVHLGLGNFHRAHQALYTDLAA